MALSVYPYAIPSFPFHRNLLDDVDATHINAIQRELSALASVLGVNPQIESDVTVPQSTVSAVPPGGGDVSPDIAYSPIRNFDPQVQTVDHGSVSTRLDRLSRNRHVHCFKLVASSVNVGTSSLTNPLALRFPLPSTEADPYSLYNGSGAVLRKSGFWSFRASAAFLMTDTPANNAGVYLAGIDKDGLWLEGSDRAEVTSGVTSPVLNPTLQGFFERGTTISLRVAQNSSAIQQVQTASLSGFLLREN